MPKARDEVTWFADAAAWRAWLEANHDTATEIWLGISKKHVRHGVPYAAAVEEALCFGWIDGVTHTVDADGYAQRFTPRKRGSVWSLVNQERIRALIAAGRVQPAGLRAWEERDETRMERAPFAQEEAAFDPEMLARFQAHPAAWAWFASQPPGYRRLAIWWVTSAKRPETRERRLATLIEDSAGERRLKQFARQATRERPSGQR